MNRPRVIIIGGGFAGLACANGLDSRGFAVTLIDRKRSFEFLPNIHELLSKVKKPAQLRLPLSAAMRAVGHRFIHSDVTAIDPDSRTVNLSSGRRLQADYLVIALGSADADYGVSGVGKHSLGFKSVAECQEISRRLATLRKGGGRVVIVGGGLEGVEALGEILRRYSDNGLSLSIIEAKDRLLPGGPAAVSDHLADYCADYDVEVINADPVARVTAKTVQLQSGRRLRSDATIWTGGPKPPALLAESGLAEPDCWAPVSATLEHPGFSGVYIAGDAAELERPISKQAYHALDMGQRVADNIERAADRRRARRYRPQGKPTLLAFGDIDSVLISERFALAGAPLAAGKEAVFTAVMTQLDRRPVRKQLDAAFARGRAATRELLWPTVRNWKTLPHKAQVKRLK